MLTFCKTSELYAQIEEKNAGNRVDEGTTSAYEDVMTQPGRVVRLSTSCADFSGVLGEITERTLGVVVKGTPSAIKVMRLTDYQCGGGRTWRYSNVDLVPAGGEWEDVLPPLDEYAMQRSKQLTCQGDSQQGQYGGEGGVASDYLDERPSPIDGFIPLKPLPASLCALMKASIPEELSTRAFKGMETPVPHHLGGGISLTARYILSQTLPRTQALHHFSSLHRRGGISQAAMSSLNHSLSSPKVRPRAC